MSFIKIYILLRKWAQPYWVPPNPRPRVKKPKTDEISSSKPTDVDNVERYRVRVSNSNSRKILTCLPGETMRTALEWKTMFEGKGVCIWTVKKPFRKVKSLKKLPYFNDMWYYHDDNVHMILFHAGPNMSFRFKDRRDAARKKLDKRCLITAKSVKTDRTHLIPYGYHGLENDERIVVKWPSTSNQGVLKQFEDKNRSRKRPFYWFVMIERVDSDTLRWIYETYDAQSLELLDRLVDIYRGSYEWRKDLKRF